MAQLLEHVSSYFMIKRIYTCILIYVRYYEKEKKNNYYVLDRAIHYKKQFQNEKKEKG